MHVGRVTMRFAKPPYLSDRCGISAKPLQGLVRQDVSPSVPSGTKEALPKVQRLWTDE